MKKKATATKYESDDLDADATVTKGEQIYRSLKTAILAGSLKPGKLLSANGLAKEYRIARSVVCESLARLKAEGLVRGEGAYSRTYVEHQEIPAVVEHYEVREAIECAAARLAALNMNAWQATELRHLADRFDEARNSGDAAAQADSNIAFHHYLVANCGNALLLKIYEAHHLAPVLVRSYPTEEMPDHDRDETLKQLCNAIDSRDADAAEAIMRTKLRLVTNELRRLATSAPNVE